jgi:hypothetical protein
MTFGRLSIAIGSADRGDSAVPRLLGCDPQRSALSVDPWPFSGSTLRWREALVRSRAEEKPEAAVALIELHAGQET